MESIDSIISKLELAQVCWMLKDIYAAMDFFSKSLGMTTFTTSELVCVQDLGMTYRGKVETAE